MAVNAESQSVLDKAKSLLAATQAIQEDVNRIQAERKEATVDGGTSSNGSHTSGSGRSAHVVAVPDGMAPGGSAPEETAEADSPEPAAVMDMLRRFVELEKRKRELKAELDENEAERGLLMGKLLSVFEQNGISNMKVSGFSVYIYRQLWASVAKAGDDATDTEQAIACRNLKDAGLGIYVQERFNTQSLSAYVREIVKAGEALPSCFIMVDKARGVDPADSGKIAVTEKYELRTRKG